MNEGSTGRADYVRVAFCQPTLNRSGSELSLLEILKVLDREEFAAYLIAGADGPIRSQLEAYLLECVVVHAPKLRRTVGTAIGFFRSFGIVYKAVKKQKKRWGVDVVYVNTLMFPQALIAAKLNRVPVVLHVREVQTTYPAWIYKIYMLLGSLLADHIIVVCGYVLDQPRLPLNRLLSKKSEIVYNVTSLRGCSPRVAMAMPVNILVVVPVSKAKGVCDLPAVAAGLRRVFGADFLIKVVGRIQDQGLYRNLRKELSRLSVSHQIEFCGETKDISTFYQRAHILLHPSYSEAFPRVLVEACAFGLPVVTTAAGGSTEAITNDYNGFVVNIGDTDAMVHALHRLVTDAALYRAFSQQSRTRYEERFHPEKTADILRCTIQKAASQRMSSSHKEDESG